MWNFILLCASMCTRMAVSLGAALLMARFLTPHEFGSVAFAQTVGTITGLLADLGGSVNVLHTAASHREGPEGAKIAAKAISDALSTKLSILAPFLLLYSLTCLRLSGFTNSTEAVLLILSAQLLASVGDLGLSFLRAESESRTELLVSLIPGVFTLALLGLTSIWFRSAAALCLPVTLGRGMYCLVTLYCVRRRAGFLKLRLLPPRQLWTRIVDVRHWAMSAGLAHINGQIDGLLVPSLAGVSQNGLYQSVARFSSAAVIFPAVAISHWAPRTVRKVAKGQTPRREMISALITLSACGVFIFASFAVAAPFLSARFVGGIYKMSTFLWAPLGIFCFIKCVSEVVNLWLISVNRPDIRATSEVIAFLCNCVGIAIAIPCFGIVGVPYALSAALVVSSSVSLTRAMREKR